MGGGLVGNMGLKGSYVDVSGQISVGGKFNAGLVENANEGVIRLAGETDLAGRYSASDSKKLDTGCSAQLVKMRGNSLVYAKGSGTDSGWKFYRNSAACDDCGDWGEVFRASNYDDYLTEDDSAHTVEIAEVTVSSGAISMDKDEFIKTALNIQHNYGSDKGALHFENKTDSAASALLADDVTLTEDIDLSDTGIGSLMRDNYRDDYNQSGGKPVDDGLFYSGTFDGDGNTVTLALGEAFGYANRTASSEASDGSAGSGMLYGNIGHRHIGLIPRSDDATVKNLTVEGNIWAAPNDGVNSEGNATPNIPDVNNGVMKIGGVIADAKGSLTVETVTTSQRQDILVVSGNTVMHVFCGGLVGCIDDANDKIVNIGASGKPVLLNADIVENSQAGNGQVFMSHGIGAVVEKGKLIVNFDNVLLGGSYSDPSPSYTGNIHYGGLISSIKSDYYAYTTAGTDDRTVNITNVTVTNDFNCTQRVGTDKAAGGFLGYEWYNTKVNVGTNATNGLKIGQAAGEGVTNRDPVLSAVGGKLGGLCYRATGYWRVNNVEVERASLSSKNLGFIVYDGSPYHNSGDNYSAIYLELISDNYDIAGTTASVTGAVYDEIVAQTATSAANLLDNGRGVISIQTKSAGADLYMDGENCNTYQNQISAHMAKTNELSRYYYNIDQFRTKASPSDPEKLMLWSLHRYAASNLKGLFTDPFASTAITGDFDMEHYSYYPVDAYGVTIGDSTFKFYSKEIDDSESGTGNTDSHARSNTSSSTQHYLMHGGLLHDAGNVTVSGDVTFSGNVLLNSSGSGFLVCGMLGNDEVNTQYLKSNSGSITLDGAWIYNPIDSNYGQVTSSTSYAPLLINKVGKNTSLDLQNVSTLDTPIDDGDPSTTDTGVYADMVTNSRYAGTSLVGKAGSDTATNINLNFAGITLDSRKNADGNAAFDNAYHTTRAIFSRATLLEYFQHEFGKGSGFYNYYITEDWNADHSAKHNVTYGDEIDSSLEFQDANGLSNERRYMGQDPDTGYFTRPDYDPSSGTNAAATFSDTVYLPYVKDRTITSPSDTTNDKHELSVNVPVSDIVTQCGKYNDPYLITNPGQLVTLAKLLNGQPVANFKVTLPDDMGTSANTPNNTANYGTNMWHSDAASSTHHDYVYQDGGFVRTDNAATNPRTADAVRQYLAGAYYLIKNDITISDVQFLGIGSNQQTSDTYNCPYAFHGVMVGALVGDKYATITIPNNGKSFIENSNGCVLKNLNIELDGAVALNQTATGTFQYNGTGCLSYGVAVNRVMAGDTVIDNVGVSFKTGSSISFSSTAANTWNRIVPVGAYVGVVVNGGVVFRNMDSNANRAGLTAAVCPQVAQDGWLYVNPIIGRVIAGYAFTEAGAGGFKYAASGYTMQNGTKNYSIPDLDETSTSKITATATAANNHVISVPDGQGLYILSCIVNSGAGSAAWNTSAEQNYAEPSGANMIWSAYRSYAQTRHGSYDGVGVFGASGEIIIDYNSSAEGETVMHDYRDEVKDYDRCNGRIKTPRIIRRYTTADSGIYRMRSVTASGSTVAKLNLTAGATYNVPQGFRGIGNIYYDNNDLLFKLTELDGNGSSAAGVTPATVNLNMEYWSYNIYGTVTENYKNAVKMGVGLFNRLVASTLDSSSSNIGGTSSLHDLKVSGRVYYDIRNLDNSGKISTYTWVTNNGNGIADTKDTLNIMAVGGLAGLTQANVRLSDITISKLNVEGPQIAGGLIGRMYSPSYDKRYRRKATINKCTSVMIANDMTSGVTVTGASCVGGMIGYLNSTWADIQGDSSNPNTKLDFYVNKVIMKGKNPDTSANFNCAGGIIGHADVGRINNIGTSTPNLIFSGYNIKGVDPDNSFIGKTRGETGDDSTADSVMNLAMNKRFFAGGVVGILLNSKARIENISVDGIDVIAVNAGGAFGYIFSDNAADNPFIQISRMTVDGGNSGASITGKRNAGGLIGFVTKSVANANYPNVQIKSCVVDNYTVESIGNPTADGKDHAVGCGGFIGAAEMLKGSVFRIELSDLKVAGCTIVSNNTDEYYYDGTGGLIGALWQASSGKLYIVGSDILLDSNVIKHMNGDTVANDRNDVAYIIGNNYNTCGFIRLVAVSVYNTNASLASGKVLNRLVGNGKDSSANRVKEQNFGSGSESSNSVKGYIILADYHGVSASDPHNGSNENLTGFNHSSNDRAVTTPAPYVMLNPSVTVGDASPTSKFLTGEGMAEQINNTVENGAVTGFGLPIMDIISEFTVPAAGEASSNTNRYLFAQSSIEALRDDPAISARFSTFNSEQGTDLTNDFAVLIVEDTNRQNTTDLINNYIRAITNMGLDYTGTSSYNFTNNGAAFKIIYETAIYKVTLGNDGRTFTVSGPGDTVASLKIDRSLTQFYMDNSTVDTDNKTFSLIDVKFKDPTSSSNVAYHLYIPVIVRKLLKYDFRIATASGMNYQRDWYNANDRFGVADEMNACTMENLGEPVTLYFEYSYFRTASEWQKAIENGDSLLRNYDKELLFRLASSDATEEIPDDTVLVLVDPQKNGKPYYARYEDAIDGDRLKLSAFHAELDNDSSEAFKPVSLNDLLTLTPTAAAGGKFIATNDTAAATVKYGDTYYRPAGTGETGTTNITVSVNAVQDPSGMYVEGVATDSGVIQIGSRYFRLPTASEASATHYSITSERYYISLLTDPTTEEVLYHYVASCPINFGDDSYPSRVREKNSARLILGNIFEQVSIDVTVDELTDIENMAAVYNDTLEIDFNTFIKIYDSMSSGNNDVRPYLSNDESSGINIYHSFLTYLQKWDEEGIRKIVQGDPEMTVTFTIQSADGTETYTLGEYRSTVDAEAMHFTDFSETVNFAEFKSLYSLNDLLKTGGAYISAHVTMKYSEDGIVSQFPKKQNVSSPYGVTISASSNVGYDKLNTAYSTSSVTGSDTEPHNYYREVDERGAKLTYNSRTKFEGSTNDERVMIDSQLGLNPLDPEDIASTGEREIRSIAVHDISDIIEDARGYDYVYCELKLSSRQDGYDIEHPLELGGYLKDYSNSSSIFFNIDDDSVNLNASYEAAWYDDTRNVFCFIIQRSDLTTGEGEAMYDDTTIEIPIRFTVLTGGGSNSFESRNQYYSNYMVYLTVTLIKYEEGVETPLGSSAASDFFKYTNAKIVPTIID